MEKININPEISKNENEGKRTHSTVEINGIPLEVEKYYFEYPKHIQEETGILGYERTIIKGRDILNIFEERCKQSGLNVISEGCDSLESVKEIISQKLREGQWKYYGIFMGLIYKFDENLSNGEYPCRTFNHVMSAYATEEQPKKTFIEDKFFLQKLFDVELSKKVKLDKNRSISSDENESILMDVYEKENEKQVGETTVGSLYKYSEKIKQDEVFLLGTDAFNLSIGRFWSKKFATNLSVGFSYEDSFFQEYVKKAYKFFLDNDYEGDLLGIEQVMKILVFGSDEFMDKFKELDNDKSIKEEEKVKELNNLFLKIRNSLLPDIDQETIFSNKNQESSYKNQKKWTGADPWFHREWYVTGYMLNCLRNTMDNSIRSTKEGELLVPIFINHNEIPQLSWGHAKYAHFVNQKGFNYIEFKHAEHLPVKNNKKE